jgi:hypothetical protein
MPEHSAASGGGRAHLNRLIGESSPYLLEHASNPVDWHPWGKAAFEKAAGEDKPVFLSVGYSSCHWCHVMARENFEREDVAEILNAHFISVKVDREERPDVDELYMAATMLLSGRGGWPNSLWMTPDGRPFFAGTFYPREDSANVPGFKTVLREVEGFWKKHRVEIETQAYQIEAALNGMYRWKSENEEPPLDRQIVSDAVSNLEERFDGEFGGFGTAPKFPPHTAMRLLFYEYGRSKSAPLLDMATKTLDAVYRGGIHDRVAGGFHRYAADREWKFPHFEKMLYDNALLISSFADAYAFSPDERYKRAALDAAEWLLSELSSNGGAFFSALDADSSEREGAYYLWSADEIRSLLGDRTDWFMRGFGATAEGNFRDEATGAMTGGNVLFLADFKTDGVPAGEPDRILRTAAGRAAEKMFDSQAREFLAKLRVERLRRKAPRKDDKIITAWNSLAVSALARAGAVFKIDALAAAADKCVDYLLQRMRKEGLLYRTAREDALGAGAVLEDYAFLVNALLDVDEYSGGKRRFRDAAVEIGTLMHARFFDAEHGGFFMTDPASADLLIRPKDIFDGATESGNAAAVRAMFRLNEKSGKTDFIDAAARTLDAMRGAMRTHIGATLGLALACAVYFDARE